MASQRQIQSSDKKTEQVSIPPHSTEAEQAVLGGIMLSNQHWEAIAKKAFVRAYCRGKSYCRKQLFAQRQRYQNGAG